MNETLVMTREEIANIATRIALEERKGVQDEFLNMIKTIGRMQDVLSLLRGDKSCFCSMPMAHSIPCLKATEILKLLAVN